MRAIRCLLLAAARQQTTKRSLTFAVSLGLLTSAYCGEMTDSNDSLKARTLQRAQDIAALVKPSPTGLDAQFAPQFLAHVSLPTLSGIFDQYARQIGGCRDARAVATPDARPGRGSFRVECDRGFTLEFDIEVEAAPPNRIAGLLLKAPVAITRAGDPDIPAAARAFEPLGKTVGFKLAEITAASTLPLAAGHDDQPYQIGSLVKLCTLSAVLHRIEAGILQWDTVLRLQDGDRSLPTGTLGTWPTGTPLTLQTLVTMLIVASDNTANDLLLRTLSQQHGKPPHADPAAAAACAAPMLTTWQYFILRALPDRAAAYARGTADERQRVLQSLPALPRAALLQTVSAMSDPPVAGWTATPRDLLGLLSRLAAQLQATSAAPARAIFKAAAAADPSLAGFRFVATKGGSDFGVLGLAFVFETQTGRRYALAAVWNGTQAQAPAEFQRAVQGLVATLRATR
jgi:beta-lactamase class A